MATEGTRVFVPDERLVWVPATVLSVDAAGKVFRVRVDPVESGAADDDYEERVVDLRADGMPDALPLQNAAPAAAGGNAGRASRVQHPAVTPGLLAGAAAGVDDMCELSHLHEPAIVYNVRARFFARAPYTYTGRIVVAVNPYRWLKALYSDALRALYAQHAWDALPPHVYATSAAAFRHMAQRRVPQSILVSGESGAGKTETVKILMEHLASISLAHAPRAGVDAAGASASAGVVQKVLKSNPLLEAFGNAKTTRNDNSSRFGKFTQLQFSAEHCLVGAECRHYLLEKSRVVAQAPGERNYHVFYQLVRAQEARYGFDAAASPADFRYLRDEPLSLDGQSDLERYQVTRDALATIGLSDGEQDELFHALCGILRLGQLDFVPLESNKSDASQPVASLPVATDNADSNDNNDAARVAAQKREIALCAAMLGVEVPALATQLCTRSVKARQEVYCVPLSAEQASGNRDALAKELYARVFAYLVRRVNHSIADGGGAAGAPAYLHIDLLDIFGFESFERNSFEQFCINFANEKLQQKFTLDVFKGVQEEYALEGVAWEFVAYRDNQDMLELLESPMGLLALLNEECVRPKGSDLSFASKIVSVHEAHPRLERPRAKLRHTHFVLHHYAGAVTYDTDGFVEKNKDSLQADLLELLATSGNGLIALMFGARASTAFLTDADLAAHAAALMDSDSGGGGGGRRSTAVARKTSSFMQETVSYKFKAQLALLMSDIASTEVHYVRCIKPNAHKSPDLYEIDAVVSQLRCAGVVEAIRITRAAFPNKMSHEKFLRRFVFMKPGGDSSDTVTAARTGDSSHALPATTAADACEQLAQRLLAAGGGFERHPSDSTNDSTNDKAPPPFIVGRTLIYFGKDVLEFLERARTRFVHGSAVCVQRAFRRWRARRRMRVLVRMVTKLQAAQRARALRQQFLLARRRCVLVQSLWRGVRSRQRAYLLAKERAAVVIQAAYRGRRARRRFARFRAAVVALQAQAKMKKQVGRYAALVSARQEQALMESEVDELKRRLEEEKLARVAIEAENTSLLQELDEVRHTSAVHAFQDSDLLPPYGGASGSDEPAPGPGPQPRQHQPKRSERVSVNSLDDAKLLDDSERMIDYLRREVTKGRELVQLLSLETEALKAENKKIKDAYTAAGASFAALNQHNKQQSKANLRLMSTHAALIKSQEEKMRKYQKQVADLKEDLKMQRNVYSAELQARVQQQDVLLELLSLAEAHGAVPPHVLERMRSLVVLDAPRVATNDGDDHYGAADHYEFHPASSFGAGAVMNRSSRSDTISSTAPVPVSVGHASAAPVRMERRSTIDAIMNNPVRQYNAGDREAYEPPAPQDTDRVSYVQSGRASLYYDEHGSQRKSRLGGVFKKIFKKENE